MGLEMNLVDKELAKYMNLEMERAVLCCCMIDPDGFARIATILPGVGK